MTIEYISKKLIFNFEIYLRFPKPQLPPLFVLPTIISDVIKISIVAFANNISIGMLYAKRNKYEISPNQVNITVFVSLTPQN